MNPFDWLVQLAALLAGAVLGSLTVGYVAYRILRKELTR